MLLSKAIAKAEKITGQKANQINQKFYFTYKGYSISFMANGRIEDDKDAVCFYVTNKARTENDIQSDYWPGNFWDNLGQCFKAVDRYTA